MDLDRTGRIIWHDLFTSDRARSIAFYERVAGWTYLTEHAIDFAWGGGEKDFVLALLDDEAGAGFAETPEGLPEGWIAYVEVADVDAAAARAEALGGAIVKLPFDVPGVGRNCLLRDPLGAHVGISVSIHGFPVPERQFGSELYLTGGAAFPHEFYAGLFGWKSSRQASGRTGSVVREASGAEVAWHVAADLTLGSPGVWLPRINVTRLSSAISDAKAMRGAVVDGAPETLHEGSSVMLRDPNGAFLTPHGAAA